MPLTANSKTNFRSATNPFTTSSSMPNCLSRAALARDSARRVTPVIRALRASLAFCLGLVACNAVALLKAALRAEHGEKVVSEQLSAYYLVLETRQTYAGMMVAVPRPAGRPCRSSATPRWRGYSEGSQATC